MEQSFAARLGRAATVSYQLQLSSHCPLSTVALLQPRAPLLQQPRWQQSRRPHLLHQRTTTLKDCCQAEATLWTLHYQSRQ